jgi:hypothetical protein
VRTWWVTPDINGQGLYKLLRPVIHVSMEKAYKRIFSWSFLGLRSPPGREDMG